MGLRHQFSTLLRGSKGVTYWVTPSPGPINCVDLEGRGMGFDR